MSKPITADAAAARDELANTLAIDPLAGNVASSGSGLAGLVERADQAIAARRRAVINAAASESRPNSILCSGPRGIASVNSVIQINNESLFTIIQVFSKGPYPPHPILTQSI